ncbi:MAG: D-alanyl-D-alanine carboxypeptidase family protein [Dehalococcoidia bacterium]|nr:D-alanyl-D-alanine carboxypeptidase family protein [Dehalococcoidia bacterium]
MHRQGFNIRRIVLFFFVAFALFLAGSLLIDRDRVGNTTVSPGSPSATSSTPTSSAVVTGTKTSPTASRPAATPEPTIRPSLTSTPAATPSQTPRPSLTNTPVVTPEQTPRPSLTNTPPGATATRPATKIDLLYPVNRQNAIPSNYVPDDLTTLTTVRTLTAGLRFRRLVLPDLEKLLNDARVAGYELVVSSAYRSYSEQESVHAYWEGVLGKVEADRQSALAGHSEHQLGTTVDLTSTSVGNELNEKFGATPEGLWLRDNAYRYGFVMTYPEGKEAVTGYTYEPWHFRYLGADHAAAIRQKATTLEEYLRSLR